MPFDPDEHLDQRRLFDPPRDGVPVKPNQRVRIRFTLMKLNAIGR